MGRKDVRQPERALYLCTLANLTNPAEVRGILQLGRGTFEAEEITPDLLLFARRILPLAGFVFVLDGDAEDRAPALIEASQYGHKLEPLFLPGRSAPEAWIWSAVRDRPDEYAREYGLTVQDLRARLASIEQTFAGDLTTRRQDVPKAMVRALANELTRTAPEIARIAGRLETEAARGEMVAFSVGLTEQIDAWRQAGAR